jgi:hypothetical protein
MCRLDGDNGSAVRRAVAIAVDPNRALDSADQHRRSGSGAFTMTGSLLWRLAATFASLSLVFIGGANTLLPEIYSPGRQGGVCVFTGPKPALGD